MKKILFCSISFLLFFSFLTIVVSQKGDDVSYSFDYTDESKIIENESKIEKTFNKSDMLLLNATISSQNNLCLFNCYESQYKKDGWESNNSLSDASNVGDVMSIGIVSGWTGTLHDVSSTEKDQDYYKVKLTVDRQIKVELKNIPSGTDYDLELYKVTYSGFLNLTKTYTKIGGSYYGGNSNESIFTSSIQTKGDYIIRVYSYSGLSSIAYSLYLSAQMPNEYISTSAYNSSEGHYYPRAIKWDFNDAQSDNNNLNIFAQGSYVSNVIFIPYSVLKNWQDACGGGSIYGAAVDTFAFETEDDLLDFIADNRWVGALLGVATVKFTAGASLLVTGASLVIGLANDMLTSLEEQQIRDALDSALTSKKGIYIIERVNIYDYVFTTHEFGTYSGNYIYRNLKNNIPTVNVGQFGDLSVEKDFPNTFIR